MSDQAKQPWWDDYIEEYIDGTLDPEIANQIERLRHTDRELAEHIDLARAMRSGFRSMPAAACPQRVTRRVMLEVGGDILQRALSQTRQVVSGFTVRQLQPVAAMLALIVVVVVASQVGGGERHAPDVADALVDVKWTLAYLSEVTRETGTTVRREALEPLVSSSMIHVVESFMDN